MNQQQKNQEENEHLELPQWCEGEEWCPITVTSQLLGRKWHPVILHRLSTEPMGFNKLQREANGISAKVLSTSLEDLQDKNLVQKETLDDQPPKKTRYSLTELGESLMPVIKEMIQWGRNNSHKL